MSNIGTFRTNLLAAIRSLVPKDVDVFEARLPSMSFEVAIRTPAIVVSYAGKPQKEPGPIGNRLKQGYAYAFTVAIIDKNVQSPAGASHAVADLAEQLMAIRSTPIATIADETLYLRFVSESGEVDPGATAQGGKYAMVQQWESDQVRT